MNINQNAENAFRQEIINHIGGAIFEAASLRAALQIAQGERDQARAQLAQAEKEPEQ